MYTYAQGHMDAQTLLKNKAATGGQAVESDKDSQIDKRYQDHLEDRMGRYGY